MRISAFTVAAAVVAIGAAANAQISAFNFPITPQQEVPPNNSNAAGAGQLLYNAGTQSFNLDIQVFGIGIPELTGWHIHSAPVGSNGPIVIHIQNLGGTWQVSGQGIRLQMTNVAIGNFEPQLFAGNLYFNLHTQAFPGGQIRGQIIPAPAGLAVLGAGGLLAARRRRR